MDFASAITFLYSSIVFGPTSIAIKLSGMSTPSTATAFAFASNASAPTWSTGRTMLTPFVFASASNFLAVSIKSSSTSDLPTECPCAFKNVYAIPPPIISADAFFKRLSRTAILEETFAPPIIAIIGLGGFVTIGSIYLTSFSIRKPPTGFSLINFAIVAVEA